MLLPKDILGKFVSALLKGKDDCRQGFVESLSPLLIRGISGMQYQCEGEPVIIENPPTKIDPIATYEQARAALRVGLQVQRCCVNQNRGADHWTTVDNIDEGWGLSRYRIVLVPDSAITNQDVTKSPLWCDECKCESVGSQHSSGIFIPGCPHDSPIRRVHQLLLQIEQNCPCGARPESPLSHPHVSTCPVEEALQIVRVQGTAPADDAESEECGTCGNIGGHFAGCPFYGQ